jgi:hypothetical protein
MILDSKGRIVWFNRLPKTRSATSLQPQVYRGKPVLTWAQRPPLVEEGDLYNGNPHSLYNVIADDGYRIIARIRARGKNVRTDLHDFVITKRNTALLMGFRYVPRRLSKYGGPPRGRVIDCLVQEVDIRTNRVLFSWAAVNHVPLGESIVKPLASGDWDYCHANSVSEDRDGNLLVSLRHTSSVYKISRRTGRTIWKLGGRDSSFRMGPGTSFYYMHDAQAQPDGTYTIFDNRSAEFDKRRGTTSKVLRLGLDTKAKTATLVQDFLPPNGEVLSSSQGNARLLQGGNVFVGWGSSPWWSEHSPDGRLLFAAHLPSRTYQSYRAFKGPWRGRPSGRPAVLATSRNGRLTVYVSWNGATEVAQWRVLGGSSGPSTQVLGSAEWQGLETKLEFAPAPALVQVQALDAAGNVIGTSPVVQPQPR